MVPSSRLANGVGNGAYGGLAKAGDGTLTLAGLNTYTGQTTVSRGTLIIPSDCDITASSGVTLAGGTINVQTGGNAPAQSAWTWATNVALASSQNVSLVGQTFTLVASVSVPSPGQNTPTGSVDFYDETTSTDLGTVAVDQSGNAALSIAISNVEDDQITATYTPDGGSSQLLTGASAPIEQQVVDLPTIGVDADVPLAWQGQAGDFLFSCMDGGSSTQATDVYFTLAADGVSGPGLSILGATDANTTYEGREVYKAEIPAGQDSVDVSVAPTGPAGGFVDVGLCPDAGYYCSTSYSSAHVGIVGNSNYPLPFSSDIFVFTPDGNYVGAALTAGQCAPMAVGISGTGTTTLTFDPTCFEVTYADGTVIEPNQPLNSSGGPFLMLDLWGVGQTVPGGSYVSEQYTPPGGTPEGLGQVLVPVGDPTITMVADPAMGTVSGTTTTVEVGQDIDLAFTGNWSFPLTPPAWQIGGKPVEMYNPEDAPPVTVLYLPNNESGDSVKFYWAAAGTYKVTCDPGGSAEVLTATFIVKAPDVEVTATPCQLPLLNQITISPSPPFDGMDTVQFGTSDVKAPPNSPAATFRGNCPAGWNYCFAQTVDFAAGGIDNPAGTSPPGRAILDWPLSGLDNAFPYAYRTAPGGTGATLKTDDSPRFTVYKGGTSWCFLALTMYYMAQPVDVFGHPIGIWVPLAKIYWTCDATANWTDTNLPEPRVNGFVSSDWKFSPTTSFPSWWAVFRVHYIWSK